MTVQKKCKSLTEQEILKETTQMSELTSKMKKQLSEDLVILERLQKLKRPNRFKDIRGFKVNSRYLAGSRPGGDFFDLAKAKDPHCFTMILTHSTRYGLTNWVVSTLTQLASHLQRASMENLGSLAQLLRLFQVELEKQFHDEDQLSIFLGWVNASERSLRYLNLGNAMIFYAPQAKDFQQLTSHGNALSKVHLDIPTETKIDLEPNSRWTFLSGGLIESLDQPAGLLKMLNQYRKHENDTMLNELVFRVRQRLKHEGDLPIQDCSMLTLDVNPGETLRVVDSSS